MEALQVKSRVRVTTLTPTGEVHDEDGLSEVFEAKFLEESYAQLRAGFVGTCILVVLTSVALRVAGETQYFAVWLVGHGVVLAASVAAFVFYRNGRFKSRRSAHTARRLSALTGGLVWGAACLLWPISPDRPSWLVLASCFAVLASSTAVTMAADPASFVLLILGTLAPALFGTPLDVFSWLVLVTYAGVCFAALLRNRGIFRDMVRLRSENTELLARALSSAASAERARDQALEAVKDKTRFLAAASHDLRQPMQALTLLSQVLTRTPMPEETRETAASIEDAALELTSLFDGILDLTQLELGRTTNNVEAVDIRAMLQDVADAMLHDAEARNVTVSVAGPRLTVSADPVLLWRVVSNLANNAMVHSGTDRILLSARSRGEHCLLQVWDQGEGIAEEDQAVVFDEFTQLANPERRRDRGVGLGLSIVQRVCAFTGWRVGVASRVGRGSAFYVWLPVTSPAMNAEVQAEDTDIRGLDVLVVEDDPLVSKSLLLALRSAGAKASLASSAAQALDLVRDTSFDVVLSDWRLPDGFTGSELAESLAKTHPALPCVVLTGELGLSSDGPAVVIRKPASHELICAALSRACAGV